MLTYSLQRIVCAHINVSTLFDLRKIAGWRKAAHDTLHSHNPLEVITVHLFPNEISLAYIDNDPCINLDIIQSCSEVPEWDVLGGNPALTPDIIDAYADNLYWDNNSEISVSSNRALIGQGIHPLPLEEVFALIDRHQDKIDWDCFSQYQLLTSTLPLVERYQDKINWRYFSMYQPLAQVSLLPFIDRYQDRIDWSGFSSYQSLTNESVFPIVDRFLHKLDWEEITRTQRLTVSFMKRYADHLYWDCLVHNKYLTLDIVEQFAERGNLWSILDDLPLTREFIIRNVHRIPDKYWEDLSIVCIGDFQDLIIDHPEWPWEW